MTQDSNELEKGIRVSPSFNSEQIALIDSLVGLLGDNQEDVVKTIFLNYLSEKGITPALMKKKLEIVQKIEKD